jgi:hypothetical protein
MWGPVLNPKYGQTSVGEHVNCQMVKYPNGQISQRSNIPMVKYPNGQLPHLLRRRPRPRTCCPPSSPPPGEGSIPCVQQHCLWGSLRRGTRGGGGGGGMSLGVARRRGRGVLVRIWRNGRYLGVGGEVLSPGIWGGSWRVRLWLLID